MEEILHPKAVSPELDPKTVTRREAIKLTGLVAALGAGLGVAFDPAEAGQVPGMMQHKIEMLQIKFYTAPNTAGKQELLFATQVPPPVQKRFLDAPGGRVQLKIELSAIGGG